MLAAQKRRNSKVDVNALADAQSKIRFTRENGDREPLRLDDQYSVAVTRYVAEGSKHYRSFFQSGEFKELFRQASATRSNGNSNALKSLIPSRWILAAEVDSGQ